MNTAKKSVLPRPKVKLIGKDGNAYSIMGYCHRAWAKASLPEAKWDEIRTEMMAGNYDHLLRTAMKYFRVS
jgi:hypothetical protein